MRIICKKPLREFWERHADVEESATRLVSGGREGGAGMGQPRSRRNTPTPVSSAHNRVVFNIRGRRGAYRLVVKINYPARIVYVRFVGTHAQYDRVNVGEV